MKEKRRSARIKIKAAVSFTVKSTGLTGDADTIDISEVGICIQSKQPFSVNSLVEVEIHLDTLKEPVKILVRVVRVINRNKSGFEVGLEFIELPFAKWNVLHSYIQGYAGDQDIS